MSSQRSRKNRPMSRSAKARQRRRVVIFQRAMLILAALIIIILGIWMLSGKRIGKNGPKELSDEEWAVFVLTRLENAEIPEFINVQLLDTDSNSRPGKKLVNFTDVVIHYVGNPGTTAQDNHDYFSNPESDVSSHFIVGLDGEIIQCIPLYEKSSASNWRNNDTISIEVCHPDETGKFTDKTYDSLVILTAWLCDLGYLGEKNIIRHYDITGKICPKYFVDHEDAWIQFKKDVKDCKNFSKSIE